MSLTAHIAVVADFDLLRDIILARKLVLIIGHLGFSADVGRFDLYFLSLLMPVDGYSDLHTLLSSRTLPHSLSLSPVFPVLWTMVLIVIHSMINFRLAYFSSIPPFPLLGTCSLRVVGSLSFVYVLSSPLRLEIHARIFFSFMCICC